jgi:iron complex outermembrane receptor protein
MLFNEGNTNASQFNNDLGTRGVLRQRDDQTATNLETFFESQLSLGAGFTSSLGFSATRSTRKNTRLGTFNAVGVQIANPAGTTYDRDFDNVSPKIGLRWDNAAKDTQFYANVSGSFEPPSFSEGGTTGAVVVANQAQTATTFEIGTRGERDFLRWDASFYHARVEDELLAITLPGPVSGTLNADKTIHQGVEVGFAADLFGQTWKTEAHHRVVLRTAWTYGDFRFDGATPGVAGSNDNRIAGVPPHLIRGELVYETKSGLYAGPTFEWVPVKSYIDHANTFSADPYALLGFKLGRRVDQGISWFIEAKNLTDETYAASHGVILNALGADQAQFLPGDGRSVFAGIEYRF